MRLARIVSLCLVGLVAATVAVHAQQHGARTPWGDPDLRGAWPSGSMIDVPFERPAALGLRVELTDAEYAAFLSALAVQADNELKESGPGVGASGGPAHWRERGKPSRQTSLVVDPPDGRLPAMTEDGARRAAVWQRHGASDFLAASPEDFTPYDRCITRGVLGSAFPNIYGSGMEIVQTPGYVILRYEMIHETRIVPLDGRPHPGAGVRSYMGDARGRWDGATLVVETTNFNGRTGSLGRNGNGNPTTDALRLVERFSLTDANTLQYRVTIDDAKTWTRPWTVAFPMSRDVDYRMFEYACHEGNYGLRNVLSAARTAEAKAAP